MTIGKKAKRSFHDRADETLGWFIGLVSCERPLQVLGFLPGGPPDVPRAPWLSQGSTFLASLFFHGEGDRERDRCECGQTGSSTTRTFALEERKSK